MKVDLAAVIMGWDKALLTLDHLLGKAGERAAADGIAGTEVLEWRLAPDMFTLRQQAQAVCNLASEWAARAAGVELPSLAVGEADLSKLKESVAEARCFLAGLDAAQLEGKDAVPITVELGTIQPTMPIGQWVMGFANTNILFHLSMAYAILRSRGVALAKPDLFAGGL